MAKLVLRFIDSGNVTLEKIMFEHPLAGEEICSIRGKDSGPFRSYRTFLWSPAVQSLSVLALRHAAGALRSDVIPAFLTGEAKTMAATLDYSISKQPSWIIDIFGSDRFGTPLLKRLFQRVNSERKRPGPVVVSINERFLPGADIEVVLDGKTVKDAEKLLNMAASIEKQFTADRSVLRPAFRKVEPVEEPVEQKKVAKGAAGSGLKCPCCGELLALSVFAAAA